MNAKNRWLKEYSIIVFGNFIITFALVSFIIPNNFINGGISGISIILYHFFHLPVGITFLIMNIILFFLAFKLLGMSFGFKSIFSTVILSLMIDFFTYILPLPVFKNPEHIMLIVFYGGALSGIGLGMVLSQGASTGGTDIIAMIINKYFHLPPGKGIWISDITITLFSVIVPSIDIYYALYGVLSVFVTGGAIDVVLEGFANTRQILIITENPEEMKNFILHRLGRGVTVFEARGGYTGRKKCVLLTVVRLRELAKFKMVIKEMDPSAFILVSKVGEVYGEGFREINTL